MSSRVRNPSKSQSTITLERWLVLETVHNTRHFVGYCIGTQRSIVSTPILSFDHRTRIGTTAGGFRYMLSGEPGVNGRAEIVQAYSVFDDSVIESRAVSNQYLPRGRRSL
jgi:hypothetical protein